MNDLEDELVTTAARLLSGKSEVSLLFIQRRLRVGYTRAAMIMDTLEKRGIIGPPKGGLPRDILPPVRCDQHADTDQHEKDESRAGIPPFECNAERRAVDVIL